MRFRCGQCKTNYHLEDKQIPKSGLKIKCKKCDNLFEINSNHIIRSSAADSVRYCSNCGVSNEISASKCHKCRMVFNIGLSLLAIDNKDYIDLTNNIGATNKIKEFYKQNKKKLIAITLLAIIGAAAVTFEFLGYTNNIKNTVASLVESSKEVVSNTNTPPVPEKPAKFEGKYYVALRNGGSFEATEISFKDNKVIIVDRFGLAVTLDKKDILEISRSSSGSSKNTHN